MASLRSTILWLLGASVAAAELMELPLLANNFVLCPGREENLTMTGNVRIATTSADGTQVVYFDVSGADPECAHFSGQDDTCSIAVYTATSCDGPAGMPLYSKSLWHNPWLNALRYTVAGSANNVAVNTGLGLADLSGRVVVVTDSDGDPLFCAPIEPPRMVGIATLRAELRAYPDYIGNLSVSGEVVLLESNDEGNIYHLLWYRLEGVDPECEAPESGVSSSCGISVHNGTTCDLASGVGEHYFYDDGLEDPWSPVAYFSKGAESTGVTIPITTGLDSFDIGGSTVVVYNKEGDRIACGVFQDVKLDWQRALNVNLDTYPGYGGDLTLTGYANVFEVGLGAQVASYSLTGVDTACSEPDVSTPNGCGIQVHSGKTCDYHAGVGGHFFAHGQPDPWKSVAYVTNTYLPQRGFRADGSTTVVATGLELKDFIGRTLVVYDAAGTRIGCGIITVSVAWWNGPARISLVIAFVAALLPQ